MNRGTVSEVLKELLRKLVRKIRPTSCCTSHNLVLQTSFGFLGMTKTDEGIQRTSRVLGTPFSGLDSRALTGADGRSHPAGRAFQYSGYHRRKEVISGSYFIRAQEGVQHLGCVIMPEPTRSEDNSCSTFS